MAILLSAVLALLPLTLAPCLLFYYDVTPKIVGLLIGTAIALTLGVRRAWSSSAGLKVFGILLMAQALSLALSTAFSTDRALSLGGSNWRRFGLVAQCAMLLFAWMAAQFAAEGPDRVRRLLRVIAVAGIPVAVYGILQYFGWDPLISPAEYRIGEAPWTIVRPPATLGHADYFAGYLVYVVFAGAALVLAEPGRWRFLGMAAVTLGSVATVFSGTRAGMLGLLAGGIFLAARLRPKIRASGMALAAVAIVAMTVFYFSPAGQMLRSRTRWFVEDARGGVRLLLWRDSLGMAAARWGTGWGPETFPIEFPRYQSAALATAYPDYYQESPHNIFLDAFAAQGALGLMIALGLPALGLWVCRRAREDRLAAGLAAALLGGVVSGLFMSFILPTAVYFYLTVGLLAAQGAVEEPRPVRFPIIKRTGKNACATLLVVFAVQLTVADWYLGNVSRLIRMGRLRDAALAYARVDQWAPAGMRADLWYSRAIGGAARSAKNPGDAIEAWQQGLAAAIRAARTSEERQNAWFNLALYYAYQNDSPHTEQSLRAAISQAPKWSKPHWVLANLLRTGGRLLEALPEAKRAAELDAGKSPEIARTYREIEAAIHISQK